MTWKLYDDRIGEEYELPVGVQRLSVGRASDNDLVIGSNGGSELGLEKLSVRKKILRTVSKYHAELIVSNDGELSVRDCGSTNGTQVNRKRIEGWTELNHGDSVMFGLYYFKVKGEESFEETKVNGLGESVKQ